MNAAADSKRKTKVSRKPRSSASPHSYTGALAEPIELPAPAGWLQSAEQWTERRNEVYWTSFEKKMPLLFQHFDLVPGDWKALALALAKVHVPGLQPVTPERRGPKRFWTLSVMQAFMAEMQAEIEGPKKRSVSDAAATLAKRQDWKQRLKGHQKPAEVLRHKYFELKKAEDPPEANEKLVKLLQRQK